MKNITKSTVCALFFTLAFAILAITSHPLESYARENIPAVANIPPSQSGPQSFADLAERLLPAVVNISSTQKIEESDEEDSQDFPIFPEGSPFEGSPFEDFFKDFMDRNGGGAIPSIPPTSLGSGFVIDAKNGYIVTNNHVIRDADEVRVTFHDDTTIKAKIIGRDEKTDLAVLQVKTDKKLTDIKWGNSDLLRVGDWILAIGNPFGLGGTVTAGIVSARQRDINSGPYDNFIQTDASINRGNSGGPMFNVKGEVIGINTAIYSPSGGSVGIGFAIPSNMAYTVIDQLIKYGKTRRGWLGVKIQTVTEEIAESLGLDKPKGALVAEITKGGPAEKTSLQPGDVILEFDGKTVHEMRELPRIVAETDIGKKVEIIYWHEGKQKKTRVKIAELEKAEDEGLLASSTNGSGHHGKNDKGIMIEAAGITVVSITDLLRKTYNIPEDANGVVVTKVSRNSDAARKGIIPGDVIVEINRKQIKTAKEAKKTFDEVKKAGKKSVLMLINSRGNTHFVGLKLQKDDE